MRKYTYTLAQAARLGKIHHSKLLALLNRCLIDNATLLRGKPILVSIMFVDAFKAECLHWSTRDDR